MTITQTITIRIKECPQCKESHDFPIEIIYERIRMSTFSGLAYPMPHSKESQKNYEVVMKCPNTTKDVIITIPASTLDGDPISINSRKQKDEI